MEEDFPPFHHDPPFLQGAAARLADGFLRSGHSHSLEPRAQSQPETRHFGRETPRTPPGPGTQTPSRGKKATDAPCW